MLSREDILMMFYYFISDIKNKGCETTYMYMKKIIKEFSENILLLLN